MPHPIQGSLLTELAGAGEWYLITNGSFYLTAVDGGGLGGPNNTDVALHSDAKIRQNWETFTLWSVGDGGYAFQASNGPFITAVNGGGMSGPDDSTCPFHTNLLRPSWPGTGPGAWERFTLEAVDPAAGRIALKTVNGNYVTAVNGGGTGGSNSTPIHTDAFWIKDWEIWSMYLTTDPLP
jgi:hypothetical protein